MNRFEKGIAIWMGVLTTITTVMVVLPFVTQESPDLKVIENFTTRNLGDVTQETIIKIQNCGDAEATDITIKILFPDNVTIKYCKDYYNTSYNQGHLIEGGIDSYYCTYRFNSLDMNYVISIRIVSTYPDFNLTNDFTVEPLPIYMQNAE